MQISKRTFMAGLGLGAAAMFAPPILAKKDLLGDLRIRRNFNHPDAAEDVAALAKGLREMAKRKDHLSLERQRLIHAAHNRQHGCWRFFPWHRAQLTHFETIIAKLSGKKDFALPYWDAAEDRTLPAIFFDHTSAFYIAGRTCTADTDFSKERWNFSSESANIGSDNFADFVGRSTATGRAEAYGHNKIHLIAGGKMGDITTAPLDPLFWLHHCNVDRVWWTWQHRHDEAIPQQWKDEAIGGFVGIKGPLPNTTAGALLDAKELGYGYFEGFPGRVFAAPPPPRESKEKQPILETVGEDIYKVSATGCGGGRRLSLRFPDAATETLRGDKARLALVEGSGVVRYSTDGLAQRVVTITANTATVGASDAIVTLGSAPAFFHVDPKAKHHEGGADYAQTFAFRAAPIYRLLDQSGGPITLSCDTIPFSGPDTAKPPAAISLELELKVTRREWK